MNFWLIAGLLLAGYLLQCFFGLMQIKNFKNAFTPLRRKGKVAIGRVNGGLRAGAIVMFAVDDCGTIIEAKRMMGVTIFAKFKELKGFEGKNVGLLEESDVERLAKPLRKAIMDAKFNYNTIMSGGEIPPRLSLFQKIGNKFSKNSREKNVSL